MNSPSPFSFLLNLIMISALKEYYKWQDGSNILLSIAGFPTTYSALIYNNLEYIEVYRDDRLLFSDDTKLPY